MGIHTDARYTFLMDIKPNINYTLHYGLLLFAVIPLECFLDTLQLIYGPISCNNIIRWKELTHMCLAIPALLKSIEPDGLTGIVEYSGNEITVSISLVSPKIGDYLLIHAGFAIEIMTKESAEEIQDIYKLLEESAHEP